MENLGWDDPPATAIMSASSSSFLWSNHQQYEIGESSTMLESSGYGILGCRMDIPQDDFGSIPELQRTLTCDIGPAMNSISAAPTATWGEALMAQSMVNSIPSPNGLITDFIDVEGVVNGIEDGKAGVLSGVTASLESLDCFLSATNSINTDTSVEDDGISMLLSDCRTLLNFGSNSAASSGESENIGSSNGNSRDMVRQAHEPIDEAVSIVSQGSSKPLDCITTTITAAAAARPNSTNKRSKDGQDGRKVNVNYRYFDLLQSDSSTTEGGFQLISENPPKKPRLESHHQGSSNINFQYPSSCSLSSSVDEPDTEAIAHMKEMIYRAAAFRPVNLGIDVVEKPRRKNVRISSDPQTVAARYRRERISEKIRVLQKLVPGGSKMDTATMLDEAANYLKFLRSQIKALENLGHKLDSVNYNSTSLPFPSSSFSFRHPFPMQTFFPLPKP